MFSKEMKQQSKKAMQQWRQGEGALNRRGGGGDNQAQVRQLEREGEQTQSSHTDNREKNLKLSTEYPPE